MDINSLLKDTASTTSAAPAAPAAAQVPPPAVSASTENSGSVTLDINTILTQLKAVESDRAQLLQMVAEMKSKMEKLTQGKKQEMQKALDTVIDEWLRTSVSDENVRAEFQKGLAKLVEKTEEDHGVWRVAVAASNINRERLQQMENMRIELDNIKKRHNIISDTNTFLQGAIPSVTTGNFSNENSRKRPEPEPDEPVGIWGEFTENLRGRVTDFPV